MGNALSKSDRPDAIVVGAGAAGLYAARHLQKEGVDVLVLEAQDRVGGRLYTVDFGEEAVDLGGQWLGPTQHRALRLTKELGLRTFDQFDRGEKLTELSGKIHHYTGFLPKMPWQHVASLGFALVRLELAAKRIPLRDPLKARHARTWDQMSVRDWLDANVKSAQARSILETFTQCVFAEHSDRISFLFFLLYGHAGRSFQHLGSIPKGAQQMRIAGGAQQLTIRMAEALNQPVRFKQVVRSIVQSQSGVRIHTADTVYEADHVIVAVPPPHLANIEVERRLPQSIQQLIDGTRMGCVIKCIIAYDQCFWREGGLSGEAISDGGPARVVFDECTPDLKQPMLVAFVFADDARRLSDMPQQSRKALVLEQLARLFGNQALHAKAYIDKDWSQDEWAGGCYVGLPAPGVMSSTRANLKQNVGRIHFAGTESAEQWIGYIEGALQSAERAACAVLNSKRCS